MITNTTKPMITRVMMKDGKMMPMDKDMTMKNGTKCVTNGECVMKSGKKLTTKDVQRLQKSVQRLVMRTQKPSGDSGGERSAHEDPIQHGLVIFYLGQRI